VAAGPAAAPRHRERADNRGTAVRLLSSGNLSKSSNTIVFVRKSGPTAGHLESRIEPPRKRPGRAPQALSRQRQEMRRVSSASARRLRPRRAVVHPLGMEAAFCTRRTECPLRSPDPSFLRRASSARRPADGSIWLWRLALSAAIESRPVRIVQKRLQQVALVRWAARGVRRKAAYIATGSRAIVRAVRPVPPARRVGRRR